MAYLPMEATENSSKMNQPRATEHPCNLKLDIPEVFVEAQYLDGLARTVYSSNSAGEAGTVSGWGLGEDRELEREWAGASSFGHDTPLGVPPLCCNKVKLLSP